MPARSGICFWSWRTRCGIASKNERQVMCLKTICKPKIIYQPNATPDTPYNVQLWHSYDGGHTFTYAGSGRFFVTYPEALSYAKGQRVNLSYDLGFGCLGNGTTVWNRMREVGGDYETVAHIDTCGAYKIYAANMPEYAKREIREHAAVQMERARADFMKLSQPRALHVTMERMNTRQWVDFLERSMSFRDWTNEQLWELYVRTVCESGYVAPVE